MESVLAAGILRHAAQAIRNGQDTDTALRNASKGASPRVLDLTMAHIRHVFSQKGQKRVSESDVREAILEAERALQ